MKIPGQRVVRTRFVQTEKYVIAVQIEMVIPEDDPSEPCLESETVEFLQRVRQKAEADDLTWLRAHGKVYAALEAAKCFVTSKTVGRVDVGGNRSSSPQRNRNWAWPSGKRPGPEQVCRTCIS